MKKKILLIIIQSIMFAILYILSLTVLRDIYLFGWIAHNLYLYIWVPIVAIIFTIFGKSIISIFITAGNIAGLLIGQHLGDYLRNGNMRKITADMTAEQVYQMQKHYGFFIWLFILISSLILGAVIQIIITSKCSTR